MINGILPMYFHLILTDDCNLCCRYCRAKAFEEEEEPEGGRIEIDEDLPPDLDFDLTLLYRFLARDPAATLTFYGGEPLLRSDLIERIVREAPVQRFMIQTNGLLLDRLAPEIVNRFSTILVSLDGREALTDGNRGDRVFLRVMGNVQKILQNGYRGELIARMTVTERTNIFDQVRYLADNPYHSFSSIHWQMDANFTGDFGHRAFAQWADTNYNPGIRALVTAWADEMEKSGRVMRWYPLIDPMEDLLYGKESLLRCGAGHANYTILTDGHISPCPIMIGMKQYYVGHIRDADPKNLPKVPVGGECQTCRIRTFCGGRCLYSAIVQPWKPAGRELVCGTVQNLYDALAGALPRVQDLIRSGRISPGEFSHEKFNGCEIIP
ncbi:Radical SAM domain protein [Methanoregula boonei 6A8]|jgi:putative peptide-modifying radical SAM enzyme|uniref:Radical SAM domain protein n=1 Tax=Methanoregula boonei (strain DSM 21154 / JCM 14090 / 6A8) TaxID=456442 RepID=A7I4U4_METB6|nr:TIGR04084 family radical SAM/SPASM domain-containing protein [Methanoregula boonei]ABS54755.1 Radical SAM domain protein [Methanoregula boonei 6A8]